MGYLAQLKPFPQPPNRQERHATCLMTSPFSTLCICPFLIMFIVSSPWSILLAVSNEKKPNPALTNRLMNR